MFNMVSANFIKRSLTSIHNLELFYQQLDHLNEPKAKHILRVTKIFNFLRKHVSKIQNNLWSVLKWSLFSLIRSEKLLKSAVTRYIRSKNCYLTSVKINLKNF